MPKIRHIVDSENVDGEGYILDPKLAVHAILEHGRLKEMGGPVDPKTHLNRDFPDHELGSCAIVDRLEPGSRVLVDDEGQLVFAAARLSAIERLGRIDIDARRLEWLQVHQDRRQGGNDAPH